MKDEEVMWIKETLSELRHDESLPSETSQKIEQMYAILTFLFTKVEERMERRNEKAKYEYGNFIPESEISKAVNALSNAPLLYEGALNDLEYYNSEGNDLMHAIEMLDFDDEKGVQLLRQLKENRTKRRVCKNFLELVRPLRDVSIHNPSFLKKLSEAQGQIQKIKETLDKRKYYVREKTDLAEAFEKAKERV